MRNLSCMYTTQQIKDLIKTVTRRLGWKFLKVGDHLMTCEKCQGLRLSEKLVRLREIEVVSTRWEQLWDITDGEVVLEGFPGKDRHWFIQMFCKANKCIEPEAVNRIEFKYVRPEIILPGQKLNLGGVA